jgi:uncharacterized short protein YbdD (DUF466 family)
MNLRFEISDLRRFWSGVRQVFGDAAYENYLRSHQRRAGAGSCGDGSTRAAGKAGLLSREEFYLDSLRRRYSGVSRCC